MNYVIRLSIRFPLVITLFSGPLYKNEALEVPFNVTNVGGGTTDVQVDIKDDQKFAQAPTRLSFRLSTGESANGSFILHGGHSKGVTT